MRALPAQYNSRNLLCRSVRLALIMSILRDHHQIPALRNHYRACPSMSQAEYRAVVRRRFTAKPREMVGVGPDGRVRRVAAIDGFAEAGRTGSEALLDDALANTVEWLKLTAGDGLCEKHSAAISLYI